MALRTWAVSAAGVAAMAGLASGQQPTTVRVASGFVRPNFVTSPPGDRSRLFVVEQRGSGGNAARADIRIMSLPSYSVLTTPFVSILGMPTNANTNSEQGLLGLAFDPNYASNGFFYVNYTSSESAAGTTHIVRYHVSANPNVADPASATDVLTLVQPFENHNGGWLAFGPDGYLYGSLGDGGSGCDPGRRAQNVNVLFGKILRLNVATLPYTIPPTNPFAGGGGAGEVWAYGLRNPFRPSFDRATGDLYIADVGQDYEEEVNFQPAATTPPFFARNYGWNCREGLVCSSTAPSNCNVSNCPSCGVPVGVSTDPVYAYVQANTPRCAVTGGYVYRGCAMPDLRGTYFFADYCSGELWSFRMAGGAVTEFTIRTTQLAPVGGPTISQVNSFGEDDSGEMYIISLGGNIFKIIPSCGPNCDSSTTAPVLNVQDFTCFLQKYASQDCYANCDGSTAAPTLNVQDFTCFLQKYATGCGGV